MAERILVVDDEKLIVDLTSMVLRSKGYEIFTADCGSAAVEVVERERPELVLLDYMMPVMDGMNALRKIREISPDSYVIMFTGKGSEEIAVELMKAGASDYILKPFNNRDMVERIQNVLRIRRIELHNRELRQEREELLEEIKEWNRELAHRVEEKSRELERAQAEIIQTEKLATLGHIAAGIAHEIRNPLNSIGLFAQILKTALAEDQEKVTYADKTLKEVDRIDQILIKFLAASKRPRYELKQVAITELIDRALESFQDQLIAQQIELQREFLTTPPPITADDTEIEQIFTNLLANALQAMPHGGVLGMRLSHDEGAIHITVSDTGGGIPEHHFGKIFDPFFTTRERGTGFGLSVVLRIVKTYGGRISVESKEGEGTRFSIELPLSA